MSTQKLFLPQIKKKSLCDGFIVLRLINKVLQRHESVSKSVDAGGGAFYIINKQGKLL